MELDQYPMGSRGESGVTMGLDFMANCKFCGLEVQWVEQFGVRIPIDPDFTDHRRSCAGMLPIVRERARDLDHEKRVAQFLRKNKNDRTPRRPRL
jgi:hypothetical protein